MANNDKEKTKKAAEEAKQETKNVQDPKDVKAFLDEKRDDILATAKKLKGDDQKNFKDIVNALNKYANGVDEAKGGGISGSKLICGLAATVAFLCSLNTIGLILSAPLYAPLLQFAVKKLAKVKD